MNGDYDGFENESVYQKTIMQLCYRDYPDLDVWSIIEDKKQDACRAFKQLKEIELKHSHFTDIFAEKRSSPFSVDTTDWDDDDKHYFPVYCNLRGYCVYASIRRPHSFV
jgi:hypothetical protein